MLDDLVGDVAHRELAFVGVGTATGVKAGLILYKIGRDVGFYQLCRQGKEKTNVP
jgi:hypothetical protein